MFREINSLVIYFDKIVAFTKFLPKMSDEVEKREIHCYAIFFRQINLQ